jgi:predicted amino acid racemase
VSAPRLEVDLDKIHHNARALVERLGHRGIGVTAVTKAFLGWPPIVEQLQRAGVAGLGDSRLENIVAMRAAGVTAPITLVRSPMLSQVDGVVDHVDVSLNTELSVLRALSSAAVATGSGRRHGVVLMVELGDLREGILPADLVGVAAQVVDLPGLDLVGIGANLACQNGIAPDARNMTELSALATSIEAALGISLAVVSGGNSANLDWALGGGDVGRVNDLRLGESILLGRETLRRDPIEGLFTDAFTLVAEVIESKVKPSAPWGTAGLSAFGLAPRVIDRGDRRRVIVAVGHHDTDPAGLTPPEGFAVVGASSDHLVLDTGGVVVAVGDEVRFGLDYRALICAMSSPFVTRLPILTDPNRASPRCVFRPDPRPSWPT